MGVKDRLRKLEGGRGPCPKCGAQPGPPTDIEVVWITDENDPRRGEEPTICSTCGRPDFYVVTWGDSLAD